MAGLSPATHTHSCITERMGRRDEPGDDGSGGNRRKTHETYPLKSHIDRLLYLAEYSANEWRPPCPSHVTKRPVPFAISPLPSAAVARPMAIRRVPRT